MKTTVSKIMIFLILYWQFTNIFYYIIIIYYKFMKFGILCTEIYEKAEKIKDFLLKNYDSVVVKDVSRLDKLDTLVVLGGDGFMLRSLHNYHKYNIPFFGINCGNVGFLLNNFNYKNDSLIEVIKSAESISLNPLKSEIINMNNDKLIDISFNELTLIRNIYKTCNLNIKVNNKYRIKDYAGDGIVISTPIGSTAYNSSIGGAIIPHNSNNIILSTISPFRPRTFRSVMLQNDNVVEFEVNYVDDRRVSAFADYIEYKDVSYVKTSIDKTTEVNLLFDKRLTFNEKIMNEQFR